MKVYDRETGLWLNPYYTPKEKQNLDYKKEAPDLYEENGMLLCIRRQPIIEKNL
jgi:hypothetical protein